MVKPADIRRLLDAFEHSDLELLRVVVDGTELVISAGNAPLGRR